MLEVYLKMCDVHLEWWKTMLEATHKAHTQTVVRLPVWRNTHLHSYNPDHWAAVVPLRRVNGK